MTQSSDLERALTAWFDEGPRTMPDRVIDVVADQIGRQRQHRAWRLPWRPTMTPTFKLAAGIAAVLVLAFAGWSLLPRAGGAGGADPSPSPSPRPSLVPGLHNGPLEAGTYRFYPLVSVGQLQVVADVPDGWHGFGSWAILGPTDTEAPDGIGIAFIAANSIFRDPCHWDLLGNGAWPSAGDVEVGPGVDDLANAVASNASYTSTTPVATTLGGFAGKRLQLQLPADLGSCDKAAPDGTSRYFVFGGMDGSLYSQGPSNRWDVSIVDVQGARLVVVVTDYAATPAALRTAAQAILDSLVFTR